MAKTYFRFYVERSLRHIVTFDHGGLYKGENKKFILAELEDFLLHHTFSAYEFKVQERKETKIMFLLTIVGLVLVFWPILYSIYYPEVRDMNHSLLKLGLTFLMTVGGVLSLCALCFAQFVKQDYGHTKLRKEVLTSALQVMKYEEGEKEDIPENIQIQIGTCFTQEERKKMCAAIHNAIDTFQH